MNARGQRWRVRLQLDKAAGEEDEREAGPSAVGSSGATPSSARLSLLSTPPIRPRRDSFRPSTANQQRPSHVAPPALRRPGTAEVTRHESRQSDGQAAKRPSAARRRRAAFLVAPEDSHAAVPDQLCSLPGSRQASFSRQVSSSAGISGLDVVQPGIGLAPVPPSPVRTHSPLRTFRGMPDPSVVQEVLNGTGSSSPIQRRPQTAPSPYDTTKKAQRQSLHDCTNLSKSTGYRRMPKRSVASARPHAPALAAEDAAQSRRSATSPSYRRAKSVSATGSAMGNTSSRTRSKERNLGQSQNLYERSRASSARTSSSSGPGGWAAYRPKTAAAPPRASDRAVIQPVLEALEAQVKLSKTVEARAMKKLGPAGHQYQSQKAKNLWNTAKRKSLKVVRDAKKKAEELMLWENQLVSARNQVIHSKTGGSYVRIARGTLNVQVQVIQELRSEFEAMDTNGIGVVPYAKLLGRINTSGGHGSLPIEVNSSLMSRAPKKQVKLERQQSGRSSSQQRLNSHVFNFEDMLQMQYPKAEPSDVKRMLGLAYPDKENLQHLKLKQVIAAVEMFNKMDPLDKGICDLDTLENVLIEEFPNENIYPVLKTLPPALKEKLYNEECITMKEFINWYARLTNEKIYLINSGQDTETPPGVAPKKLEPTQVLGGYLDGYESRVQFRKANMNSYLASQRKYWLMT